jgi:hypothetical protein
VEAWVGIKKAMANKGRTAREPVQENTVPIKKPVDVVQARANVADLVRNSAGEIAMGMIEGAKAGQLASAKYLFEVAGLYPATEETEVERAEDSLAYTLLKRMGLPTEPVISENIAVAAALTRGARDAAQKTASDPPEDAGGDDWRSAASAQIMEREPRSGSDTVE